MSNDMQGLKKICDACRFQRRVRVGVHARGSPEQLRTDVEEGPPTAHAIEERPASCPGRRGTWWPGQQVKSSRLTALEDTHRITVGA